MAIKTALGHNADLCYEHSGNSLVEFFSKAGSLFEKSGTYYGGESKALDLFKPAFQADRLNAIKLLCWLRDCRGGCGSRSGFRSCLNWLAQNYPEWVDVNIDLIPHYGRWDDLSALYGTPCEKSALAIWSKAIKEQHGLACKWADRKDNKLRAYMKLTPKAYRKLVVKGTDVVEQKMCANEWTEIDYEHIPSKAMSLYTNAFTKRDASRFNEYKEALKSGEKKINAAALFPHDCVRTCKNGDPDIGTAQFDALPNYLDEVNGRIMVVTDFSGSMEAQASGSVSRMDVALGLGLYCSEKLGKDSPFHRHFVAFSGKSQLIQWTGMTFAQAVRTIPSKYGFCENTNIYNALVNILDYGKQMSAKKVQYPTALLIVSDMQFDGNSTSDVSSVESALRKWDEADIPRPAIVYWNLAGYSGNQADALEKNVALVSGFSPAVIRDAFMRCGDPIKVMMKTIERYDKVREP